MAIFKIISRHLFLLTSLVTCVILNRVDLALPRKDFDFDDFAACLVLIFKQ